MCDFLLVINTTWHPISYRFGVIAVNYSNLHNSAFWSLPLGLRDNVQRSCWADWKVRGRLPISVNWTFFY